MFLHLQSVRLLLFQVPVGEALQDHLRIVPRLTADHALHNADILDSLLACMPVIGIFVLELCKKQGPI